MADTTMTLYRGSAPADGLMYKSPIGMATCITSIVVCNTSGGAQNAAINLLNSSGTAVPLLSTSVAANTSQYIDLNQIVYNQETITGSADGGIRFHIAGYEV